MPYLVHFNSKNLISLYLFNIIWLLLLVTVYYLGSFYTCYDPCLLCTLIPIKIYPNAEADKGTILKDNTNKSGIYMWKNSINGKRYIGSSENLKVRFLQYFNINHLLRNTYMYIYRALLKHGYSNFSLTII
jgi:hypothetical protein